MLQDLSHHPMFWKSEELSWLSACDGAQAAVLKMQDRHRKREGKVLQAF